MLVLAAGVQAAITGSTITSPADGALLFQNYGTDPAQMLTVTGTVDGVSGNVFDIDCFHGSTLTDGYDGPTNAGTR